MNCFYPLLIKEKKDGAFTGKKINVPCGKCPACMAQKRAYWSFRLTQEALNSESAHFITLTYDPLYYELFEVKNPESLKKNDLIKYLKRLRKVEPKLKYFAVGEYGGKNERPHYHAVLFNVGDTDQVHDKWSRKGVPIGRTHCVHSNSNTIHYLTKYLVSDGILYNPYTYKETNRQKPFQVMSKGLGKCYVDEAKKQYHLKRQEIFTKLPGNIIQPLPRYIREKIFEPEQLKILNELARKKAVEKEEEKTWDHVQSERYRLKKELSKKSKSNENFQH